MGLKTTIIGGGNLGHVMAGILSHSGSEITILSKRAKQWKNQIEIITPNNISIKENIKVSHNIRQALYGADHILLCLPGYMIKSNLELIKPYLNKNTIVGSIVSSSGFFWIAKDVLGEDFQLFGFQRVPFISRVLTYGQSAAITGERQVHKIAITKNFKSPWIIKFYEKALNTKIIILNNYLEASLTNSNPILHPARLFGMFQNWNNETTYKKIPLFYEDWDLISSKILVMVDMEFQNLIKRLPLKREEIPSIIDYYGCSNEIELTNKIRSIDAFKKIKTPMVMKNEHFIPDLKNRYFTEDIPYGIVIVKSLAIILKEETPQIDNILFWAQDKLKKSYFSDKITF